MKTGWRLLLDGAGEPAANMEADLRLAGQVLEGRQPPTLRVYGWLRPAVSLGRRQPESELSGSPASSRLPSVRRPTGGGAVAHTLEELTYAAAFPRSAVPAGLRLANVPSAIHAALREKLSDAVPGLELVRADQPGPRAFCFSAPVCGDLVLGGRKVAGSAVRAWREGMLIQGSIQGIPADRKRLAQALFDAVKAALPVGA